MKTKVNLTEREFEYYVSKCATNDRIKKVLREDIEGIGDFFEEFLTLQKGNASKLYFPDEDGKFDNFAKFCVEINNMNIRPEK